MQVNSVGQKLDSGYRKRKTSANIQNQPRTNGSMQGDSVAFTGGIKSPNFVVSLMDLIATGGYAVSFCIQDGLGFVFPRVGKGLLRGGKKKHDKNGNEILDKNGEPKRELNWAYARKEGIREIITGPSAFIIPWFLLKGINKKFGRGNSVRLDYIDGFKNAFADYAQKNKDAIISGNADKKDFYKEIYKNIFEQSINKEKGATPIKHIDDVAEYFANKQIEIEKINKDFAGFKNRKARKEALSKLVTSIEDDYMALRKKHIGGTANDMAIAIKGSDGKIKGGSIGELTTAMSNYFDDAVKNVHDALGKAKDADIKKVLEHFTNRRMGSRLLTNFGLFATVALFYTQIPKLYNMGTHGKNPALMNDEDSALASASKDSTNKKAAKSDKKDVSFSGGASMIEKAGDKVFNSKNMKNISDVFELNGPVIQGNAMAALLYGFCIPPRLVNAQDKYDYGEILVRDLTAFTALLFGAKALSRLFSDGFTKLTGLALNKRDTKDLNFFQKAWAYLNPADKHHSILSSKQLDSKYTDIQNYKNGIDGFVEFIEGSNGNIKKALTIDPDIKKAAEEIVQEVKNKSYAEATKEEIIDALHQANIAKDGVLKDKLSKLYECFKRPADGKLPNKLLNKAKTCNSLSGALSTLVFVPSLIIALTDICKSMTEKRQAKEKAIKSNTQALQAPLVPSNKPTMAGFLNKTEN